MKILAAMSGGVDSAVAAARMVDAGHEIVGVHLALNRMPGMFRSGSRGCCTIEDSLDAQRVANILDIPYYVWDFSERFVDEVINNFVDEYQKGRTPNPCMRCNEKIKFSALLERALQLGFDGICTGHYASVVVDSEGNKELHRAQDNAKDQSYVLAVLTEEELDYVFFPLGQSASKELVRKEAKERGLAVANKPDSHDICFIPDGDTAGWLENRLGARDGDIVDVEGKNLGKHEGYYRYTIGQRKGLNVGFPSADGQPRYVLDIRPVDNTVVVGSKQQLAISEMGGESFTWIGRAPEKNCWFECEVQVRAHAQPVACQARIDEGVLRIRPLQPLEGIATGQTAALYIQTRVLGQMTIDHTQTLQQNPVCDVPETAKDEFA